MKTIAYLSSVYARASDSFVRAEVLELRRLGHRVHTFSVRAPAAAELVSEEIRAEHARTDYILAHGLFALFVCMILELLRAPARTLSTLRLAARCGWPGIKGRLWPAAYFLEACYLARALRKKRVDHLHNHIGEGSAVVAMLASELSGVPYSLTIHGPFEFDQPALLALGEKVRRSRFTAAVCDYGRSQLLRWTAPADWPKIHVVRCGVRLNGTALTAPNGERLLLCVGRLGREKGHLVLLEAVARLRAEPGFALLIVGDGPARGEIEARAAALGIEQRVRLTGWLAADEIRGHILRCRALVLPTFAEGLPVVLMEALALGRPVITSYVAGIPELVQPGVSGWVVPAGSVDELARALREALSADPHRLAGMGRAGAARVRERHDQVKETGRLQALIENRHVLL